MTTPFGRRFNLVRFATPAMIGATLALAPAATAQTDTGRVTGVVTDTIGAGIPGATLTLTNLDNGSVRTLPSQKDGRFTFVSLMRGHYRIEVVQTGFGGQKQPFQLDIQQVRTVQFRLAPGKDGAMAEVNDAVKAVDLSTPAFGTTVTYDEVTELPIANPNFTQLALLTPGVTRGATASDASGRNPVGSNNGNETETYRYSSSGGAAISSNGQRPQANTFLIDGMDNNEPLTNTIVFFTPPEAIQEFRVTTSIAPPELGKGAGATINVSTRSGTNKLHGSGFGYYRSGATSASPLYFAPTGTAKPNLQQKTYGGSLGGPIFKNHAYLFVDYQAFRQKGLQDANFHTVPTTDMRIGNFTELLGTTATTNPSQFQAITGCTAIATGNPILGAIYDPTTCRQFGAAGTGGTPNVIGPSRINPAGFKYLNSFDLPNRAGILQNFYSPRTRVQNYSDADARLDFKIKQSQAFIRISYAQDALNVGSAFSGLTAGGLNGATVTRPRGLTAGLSSGVRKGIFNDLRFNYVHFKNANTPAYANSNITATLGIPTNNVSGTGGGPLIAGAGAEIDSTGDGGSYFLNEDTYQLADTVSYVRKRQTFRAGVSYLARSVAYQYGNVSKGYFAIGGNPAGQPGTGRFTGYEVSELLSGFTDYEISPAQPQTYFTHNIESDFFLQDDWHLSKKMTLDLGLRYDLNTSPYEDMDRQSDFDIRTQQLYLANYGGQKRALNPTDKNNFAPRVGFAYDLLGNGKTTIRGGFGMFFFMDRGGVANQLSNNAGFNGAQVFTALGVNQPVPLVPPTTAIVPSQYLNLFDGQRIGLTGMGTPNIVSTSVSGSATTTTVPALYNNNNNATRPLFQAYPSGTALAQFYAGAGNGATTYNNITNVVPGQAFPSIPVQVGTLGTGPAGAALIANQQNNQNSTVLQYNLQIQQQLDHSTTATIAFVGSQGQHLMNWFNLGNPYLGGSGATLFPLRSSVLMEGAAGGSSHYAGFQAKLERNVADGLSATLAYAFSHALDNGNGAFNNGVTGSGSRVLLAQTGGAQLGLNYGNSDQDQRHVLVASSVYKLPFGHGKRFLGSVPFYVDEVIGGWQINPLLTLTSGTPIDFDAAGSPDNRPDAFAYGSSARGKLGGPRNASNLTYFNGTFGLPPVTAYVYTRAGTLSRNKYNGPGYANLDMSAFKGFHVTDRVNLEFRAAAFNLLNHPQFGAPDTNVRDGNPDPTGTVFTTGSGSPLGTINSTRPNSQRQVDLGVHARF